MTGSGLFSWALVTPTWCSSDGWLGDGMALFYSTIHLPVHRAAHFVSDAHAQAATGSRLVPRRGDRRGQKPPRCAYRLEPAMSLPVVRMASTSLSTSVVAQRST